MKPSRFLCALLSSTLLLIARENNITVLALAQLNRESEKKGAGAPKMSQMRESGSLEQDACVAGVLYRVEDDEDGGRGKLGGGYGSSDGGGGKRKKGF